MRRNSIRSRFSRWSPVPATAAAPAPPAPSSTSASAGRPHGRAHAGGLRRASSASRGSAGGRRPERRASSSAMPRTSGAGRALLRRRRHARREACANGLRELRSAGAGRRRLGAGARRGALPGHARRRSRPLIDACEHDEVGGLLAHPAGRHAEGRARGGRVAATLTRADKWLAQTPQMFRLGMLRQALERAGDAVTDEASAIEAMGLAPLLVPGSAQNFKVTYPEDFALAEAVLRGRAASRQRHRLGAVMHDCAVGEGWDVHALVPGRSWCWAASRFRTTRACSGHSDADVLLHAITDALLGAAGLGDIGRHFPDTDRAFRGADSVVLLAEAARACARPAGRSATSTAPWSRRRPSWRRTSRPCASASPQALGVALEQVNVKAKTAEKMGPVGEGRAIEARAVVLLHWAPEPRRLSRRCVAARLAARAFAGRRPGTRRLKRARCSRMCAARPRPGGAGQREGAAHALRWSCRRSPAPGRRRRPRCARRRRGRRAWSAATASPARRRRRGRAP